MKSLYKSCSYALMLAFLSLNIYMPAQAGLIATETVLSAAQAQQDRARIHALLERQEVRDYFAQQGVDPQEASLRVQALSDAEVAQLASKLDTLPAGASLGGDLIGAAVVVFIVLLVTDILGFTDIFPFVKKTAR